MARAYHGRELGAALVAEGICPSAARGVELHIPADGAIFLRYEVLVYGDDLAKLARAFATLAIAEAPRRDEAGA